MLETKICTILHLAGGVSFKRLNSCFTLTTLAGRLLSWPEMFVTLLKAYYIHNIFGGYFPLRHKTCHLERSFHIFGDNIQVLRISLQCSPRKRPCYHRLNTGSHHQGKGSTETEHTGSGTSPPIMRAVGGADDLPSEFD